MSVPTDETKPRGTWPSIASGRIGLTDSLPVPANARTLPSAVDDGVCLDLDEPAGIEEPLDDDETGSRPGPAEGLAVHL